jgi:hypothetical protein
MRVPDKSGGRLTNKPIENAGKTGVIIFQSFNCPGQLLYCPDFVRLGVRLFIVVNTICRTVGI